ncbi:hypothetical protein Tco_0788335 [Tanacetum coccineum]
MGMLGSSGKTVTQKWIRSGKKNNANAGDSGKGSKNQSQDQGDAIAWWIILVLPHVVKIVVWFRDLPTSGRRSVRSVGYWGEAMLTIEEDPRTYNEAMQSRDAAFWKEAIDDEIGSIMENKHVLIPLRPILGVLQIGCFPMLLESNNMLRGTKDFGLSYVGYPSVLKGFSDASWINHVEDSSSTSGWFVALAAAGKEAEWLRNLIHEILIWQKLIASISIRCDSAPTMAKAYKASLLSRLFVRFGSALRGRVGTSSSVVFCSRLFFVPYADGWGLDPHDGHRSRVAVLDSFDSVLSKVKSSVGGSVLSIWCLSGTLGIGLILKNLYKNTNMIVNNLNNIAAF